MDRCYRFKKGTTSLSPFLCPKAWLGTPFRKLQRPPKIQKWEKTHRVFIYELVIQLGILRMNSCSKYGLLPCLHKGVQQPRLFSCCQLLFSIPIRVPLSGITYLFHGTLLQTTILIPLSKSVNLETILA